jgi:hypothetical protein
MLKSRELSLAERARNSQLCVTCHFQIFIVQCVFIVLLILNDSAELQEQQYIYKNDKDTINIVSSQIDVGFSR